MSLAQILAEDTVDKVVAKQKDGEGLVFAVQGEELGHVAMRMAKRRVSAAPVFSDPARATCLGMVDFADIVAALLKKCEHNLHAIRSKDSFWQSLAQIKVESAMNASGKDSAVYIASSAPLMDATKLFAEVGIRRLLVVDGNNRVVGVLSPSALTSHAIARLRGILDPALAHTVEDLNMGNAPVFSVTKSRPFLEALVLMGDKGYSCVAVVDDATGVLAGSVSMSDIKLLFVTEDFSILTMSCWDFIIMSRSLQDTEQFPFFGVGLDSKILSCVSKLLATQVHHVYVVDKAQRPKRIIGFSDVCRALLKAV